jgi:uncharacterized membrane protein YfcA
MGSGGAAPEHAMASAEHRADHHGPVNGDDVLLAVAGLGAGFVNGVAGGGSLISFPALLATGQSALVANVTSTVGIWTGYVGGVAGFRSELTNQRARVRALAPVALGGGLAGSVLLLVTPEDAFAAAAPFLVLAACALFAAQPRLTATIRARPRTTEPRAPVPAAGLVGTFGAGIYGAYFGGGLGVVLLTVLGLALEDSLVRINGLRGVLALLINSLAVVVFAAAADVQWRAAAVLATTALVGGYLGARVSRRMPVPVLRAAVIALGVAAAVAMLA